MKPLVMDFRGLRRVISGGQDGVDLGALAAARELSVKTGGTAPKGFRTAHGDDPSLALKYSLKEHSSRDYPPRTELNVADSDGTLIIASVLTSPGTKLTLKYINRHSKPHRIIQVPKSVDDWDLENEAQAVVSWIISDAIEVLNVAGNHKRPDFHYDVTFRLMRHVLESLHLQKFLVYGV